MAETGLFQWLKWGTATANAGTGVVDGGDLNLNPNTRSRIGIGGNQIRRGGVIGAEGAATMYVTDTNFGLWEAAKRATYPRGAPTAVIIEGGATSWGRQYPLATTYINEATFDYAQGEGLKQTISWISTDAIPIVGSTQPAETAEDFEDYEFVVQFGAAGTMEYEVQSFSLRLTNNITAYTAGDTKAAGSLRKPIGLVYGMEELTFGLNALLPLSIAETGLYWDCLPDDLTASIVGTNCDGDVITIELERLIPADPESMGFVDPSTLTEWANGFMGDGQNGSIKTLTLV